MKTTQSILATKYAKAFLNVYGDTITLDDYYAVQALADALVKDKQYPLLLALTSIDPAIKLEVLKRLCEQYKVPAMCMELIKALLHDKRILLLSAVLKQVAVLYKEYKGIASFTITSSHELSAAERESIQKFLARETGYAIMYEYRVDKKLIAGLRLQSDTFLWEYSIDKQLRTLSLSLIH